MAIKISAADKAFSDALRAAHDHTCEMCGIQGRMETSHVFSRRHRGLRWSTINANCLCNGCHRKWHESPLAAASWFRRTFGEGRWQLLEEKRNQVCKVPKSEEKEIAKHYRQQLKIIEAKRAEGQTGFIDFESWQ